MTLFSAIIPVYNGEKFLAGAVQSVFDLGYEPLELERRHIAAIRAPEDRRGRLP